MGIYLNQENDSFAETLRSEIYVDKTELIACTNKVFATKQKYICISRPRRFGKSMTTEMLTAYYGRGCDSSILFQGLKIANDPTFRNIVNNLTYYF